MEKKNRASWSPPPDSSCTISDKPIWLTSKNICVYVGHKPHSHIPSHRRKGTLYLIILLTLLSTLLKLCFLIKALTIMNYTIKNNKRVTPNMDIILISDKINIMDNFCVSGIEPSAVSHSQMKYYMYKKMCLRVRVSYCFTPYQQLWLYNGAPLVAFYDTLGIRRTYSRLKPPASSRGEKCLRCVAKMHEVAAPPPKTHRKYIQMLSVLPYATHSMTTEWKDMSFRYAVI